MGITDFVDRYKALYPPKNLGRPFSILMYELSEINDTLSSIGRLISGPMKSPLPNPSYSKRTLIRGGLFLEGRKIFWLFWDTDEKICDKYDDFSERATNLILEQNYEHTTLEEYAALLYISYQDEETQQVLRNTPSSMLDDILIPIAENNKIQWHQRNFNGATF
jgi:hypothetical protein